MRARRPIALLLDGLSVLLGAAAALVVAAWGIGRLGSDRTLLTQWLLWIPTPALLWAVVLGMLTAAGPGRRPFLRRRRVRAWLACAALLLAYFVLLEHRFLHWPRDAEGVTVVHWNMSYFEAGEDMDEIVDPVLATLGDLTLLVDAWGVRTNRTFYERLPEELTVFTVPPVTVLSRPTVLEARRLVAGDAGDVVLLRLDCRESLGRELVVYVVDLPSDPRRHRMEIARELRRQLDQAGGPPPDVVAGDFNIERGSASLGVLFPTLRHAYDEAGHGYGASFHRGLPLYHIDHVLVADTVECLRYDLTDPGLGRHLAQRARLGPARGEGTD